MEALPRLRSLDLQVRRIDDDGLADLEKLSQLQDLSINGTQVTDAGSARLKKGLKNLQKLILYATEVTDTGSEQFKDSRI